MSDTIFIFSDLHGQADAIPALVARIECLNPSRVVFLGDSLWPTRSATAAAFLNSLADKITAVAGNCDDEKAQLMLDFPLAPNYAQLQWCNRTLFLSHGDRWNANHLPPAGLGDVVVFGHTHVPFLHQLADGTILVNPGSCALPRGTHPPTCAWLADHKVTILECDSGKEIFSLDLNQNQNINH